jgi:chorismate dehydratase
MQSQERMKPYIAASSYLNTAPLCHSFVRGEQSDRCEFLSDAAPARCAELLRQGRADAAMIPVIEYQRIGGLRVAPGACVASKNRVRSVVLASRVPIQQVRQVSLDTSSRTSAALVQIILGQFYGLAPKYREAAPVLGEMLECSDAALIIGDPAMLIDRASLAVYDLAEEWRKHTGLPFVFAFWAIRMDSRSFSGRRDATTVDFAAAKREGLHHVQEIAAEYSSRLGLPHEELVTYLTENISFDLDEDCLRGLRLYYDLAMKSGLIERAAEVIFSE